MDVRPFPLLLLLALLLSACGQSVDLPTGVAASSDPDLFTSDPSFEEPASSASTSSAAPDASIVNPHVGSVLPNNFYRLIGQGYFQRWLHHPVGLATVGDFVLVADAERSNLLGQYGAIVEFDGRASNAVTPIGGLFSELTRSVMPKRLSGHLQAIAANDDTLLAMDDQGTYGFMLDSRSALNLGASFASTGAAVALTKSTFYVAQGDRIRLFSSKTFAPEPATPSIPLSARGLATDASGGLFVATATHVYGYVEERQTLSFDGKGTDGTGPGFEALAAIAVDPRNGDLYALDRHAVFRFDAAGRFLSRFAQERLGEGASIAVGASGDVYVADSLNNQVLQFEPGR